MDNRMRKPVEENLEADESFLIKKSIELSELRQLQGMKETNGWMIRTGRIRKRLESVEKQLMEFDKMTDRLILLNLAEWKMLRHELSLPNDIDADIEVLESQIAMTQKRINERKSRLRVPSA